MKPLYIFQSCLLTILLPLATFAGEQIQPIPTGVWKEHGLTEIQRNSIREAFQKGVDEKMIPGGAMVLIHRGENIFEEAFGLANLETKKPFTVNTPCRIASLTKPHTSTMISLLADQGKLSLNDRVDKYIPEFKEFEVQGKDYPVKAPTLAQCLSHTAGFGSNNELKAGQFTVNLNGQLEDVMADLATKKLMTEPGTKYAYSRLGYMTAGRVAEIVTGKSYQEVMEEVLFKPIGARDSTFDLTDELSQKMATPYEKTKKGLIERTGLGMGTAINPGGNLITTLDGVSRLFMLHRNRGKVDGQRIISEETLKKMYILQPGSEGSGMGYGLGFRILQKRPDGTANRIQHTGASGTIGIIDFDLDLIVIILTQVPQAQTNNWRRPLLQTTFNIFQE